MKSDLQNQPIFLLGSPRSGTSWLGNILDSHPSVLLRHEPDTVLRGDYPFVSDEIFEQDVVKHVAQLIQMTNIKVVGTRPVFRKDYHSMTQHLVRKALVYGAKGLGSSFGIARNFHVPDFVDVLKTRIVIKSVSALGRAGSIAKALPEVPVIIILRHPCGHVDSILRGRRHGFLSDETPLGFCDLEIAAKYGLSQTRLEACEPAVRLAWRWAVLNEKAIADIPWAKIVIYEDLCRNPVEIAKELFEFLDLKWSQQTSDFIIDSTRSDGSYFETSRNPLSAANKWRENPALADQVCDALEHTKAYQFFKDSQEAVV